MQPRVVVTRRIPEAALQRLEAAGVTVQLLGADAAPSREELIEAVRGAAGLVCLLTDRVDEAVLRSGEPTLRVVANVAVGVDNIDLDAARRQHVVVTNTPGVLDAATADLAILLLLAVRRRLLEGVELLRSGHWRGFALDGSLGTDLEGSTLGLVGYGRIARKVAARAGAFEVEVLHHARTPTGVPGYVSDLDELLERSDAVSLHVPLTPLTEGLLDARRIERIGPKGVLINTARGPVVDEDALCDALESRRLGGAGLDVFVGEPNVSRRLLDCPNVVATPHVGSATNETRAAMAELAVSAVLDVLAGRAPATEVTT